MNFLWFKDITYKEDLFSFKSPAYMCRAIEAKTTLVLFKEKDPPGVLRLTRILPAQDRPVEQLMEDMRKGVDTKVTEMMIGNNRAFHWKETQVFGHTDFIYWDLERIKRKQKETKTEIEWAISLTRLMNMKMYYWCFGFKEILFYWSYRTFLLRENENDVQDELKKVIAIMESIN